MNPFGRHFLAEWSFDPDLTYLNHGTVGATPTRVLLAQRRIQDEIERNPSRFLLRDLSAIRVGGKSAAPGRLRQAADQLGSFLGADGSDLVFVDNATAGVGAILRSLDLGVDDEIVISDLAYGGVAKTATYAARLKSARVVRVEMPHPVIDPAEIVAAFEGALTPRTRVVVVDHVTAESALVLPVAEIARRCRAQGVLVLVDGAHAPGGIALDITSLGVDFYAANMHKWGWAPRSCGVLWAAKEHQIWLHPPVVSWGLDAGFTTEFDWVGTRDPSPYLAAPDAVRMMTELGVEAVQAYNHTLAWRAGQFLADRWHTPLETPESLVGSMVTIRLPPAYGSASTDAGRLRDALLFEDHIEVQAHAWRGRVCVRLSAQIYNDMSDIDRFAAAVESHHP